MALFTAGVLLMSLSWVNGPRFPVVREGRFGISIQGNPVANWLCLSSPVLPLRRERDHTSTCSGDCQDRHGFASFPILTGLNETFIFMTVAIMAG